MPLGVAICAVEAPSEANRVETKLCDNARGPLIGGTTKRRPALDKRDRVTTDPVFMPYLWMGTSGAICCEKCVDSTSFSGWQGHV